LEKGFCEEVSFQPLTESEKRLGRTKSCHPANPESSVGDGWHLGQWHYQMVGEVSC